MSYIILFFSAINFLLGIAVFLRTKHERENIAFLFFATIAGIWTFNNFYLRFNPDVLFLKIAYGLGLFVSLSGLIWIYFFLKKPLSQFITLVSIPLAVLLFYAAIFSNEIVSSLESIELLGYEAKTGSLFPVYSLYLGTVIGIILYQLLHHLSTERDERKRNLLKLILFGTVFFATTSFFASFFIPVVFHTFRFTILDNLSFSVFLFSIGYAIIRFQLFNIRVIAAELLTFSTWMFLLTRILLANSAEDRLIDGGLLAILIFFGFFLIKSVIKEVKQREKLEELSEELEEANAELKKLDEAKSEFISIASHQLRAPLTVIKGYTSMVLEGTMGEISQAVRDALQKTYVSGEKLIKLIASLLDLSRIESGKIHYEFKPTDLGEVIQKVAEEFRANADEKNITLVVEKRAEHLPLISLDPDKIREAVINFVDNAIKYTPDGKSVWMTLEKKTNSKVRFSVRDEGMGIKKEDIKKLFSKFNRADEARMRDPNGMGIGLYFVKRVVEDHGGKVGVESAGMGKGSVFFIELPLKTR